MTTIPNGTIASFEDLEVYKLGRELRNTAYALAKTLPAEEKYVLDPQMRRAALSVTNNLAEGFGRYHFQDNIRFCFQSRGSANELLDDFTACLDLGYIEESAFQRHKNSVSLFLKSLNGYIAAQRRQKALTISRTSLQSPVTNHQSPARARLRGERGFTFIEIMVVVAILAILAALVVPRVMGRTDEAKRTAAKVQIRNIEGGLQLYKLDNGVYPSTEQGLKALVEKPTVGVIPKKWKADGYLAKIPDDPWANPYKYVSPTPKGDYEITSYGTDGEPGGDGKNADITNFNLDKD